MKNNNKKRDSQTENQVNKKPYDVKSTAEQ